VTTRPLSKGQDRPLLPANSQKCSRQEALCRDQIHYLRHSPERTKRRTRTRTKRRRKRNRKRKPGTKYQLLEPPLPRAWILSSGCWNKHLQHMYFLCSLGVETYWVECFGPEIMLIGRQSMSSTTFCWKIRAESRLPPKCQSIRFLSHLKHSLRTLGEEAWARS
jgi:hypothetical protein